jgi:hypothetical protein
MIREGTTRDLYTGRGGQLATLAELLLRHCNVAIPEVDEGDDALVFVTDEPDVARLQIKTATAELLKAEGCYAARVSVPLAQLHARESTRLHYVFAIRLGERWSDFVIVARHELVAASGLGLGYVNKRAGELQLYLSFSPDGLRCSDQDWSRYRNAWASLGVVRPRPEVQKA